MAIRKLKESEFRNISEGEMIIRVKEIDDSQYADFEKLVVILEDVTGATAKVTFNFLNEDGNANEICESVYARMCKNLLGDNDLEEVDFNDLVDKFAKVEIIHKAGSKGGTFANVQKWLEHAEGFAKAVTPIKPAPAAKTPAGKPKTAAEILAEARAKKSANK